MSGTGKGVSSALALSNAITNLAGKSFLFISHLSNVNGFSISNHFVSLVGF
jgi:hypothetical protein